MAAIQPTVTTVGVGNGAAKLVVWTPVTSADTCVAVSFPDLTDRSVQVSGVFDNASVAINGSNINGGAGAYAALRDPTSTTIAITAALIRAILENTLYTQPAIIGGGGSQSLTISMLFHLSQPLRA